MRRKKIELAAVLLLVFGSLTAQAIGAEELVLLWPNDRSATTRDAAIAAVNVAEEQVLVRNPNDGSVIVRISDDAERERLRGAPGMSVQTGIEEYPVLMPGSVRVMGFVEREGLEISEGSKDAARSALERLGAVEVWRSRYTHAVQYDVPADSLSELPNLKELHSFHFNRMGLPSTTQSIALVMPNTNPTHWPSSWGNYYVGVIDTGVDRTIAGLSNNRVNQNLGACFSNNGVPSWAAGNWVSTCPNGQPQMYGGAAGDEACVNGCSHGTAVASVVASTAAEGGLIEAADVQVVSVQVMTRRLSGGQQGAPNYVIFEADVQRALEYFYSFGQVGLKLGAVNMSLYFLSNGYNASVVTGSCNSSPLKTWVSALRVNKIPTVIAAGNVLTGSPNPSFPTNTGPGLNSSFYDGTYDPACISDAITVSATRDDAWAAAVNQLHQGDYFSTMTGALTDVWAPGSFIDVGPYTDLRGTSFAAPHVAAVWTRLRGKYPGHSVNQIFSLLWQCGLTSDSRSPFRTKRRACIKSNWN